MTALGYKTVISSESRPTEGMILGVHGDIGIIQSDRVHGDIGMNQNGKNKVKFRSGQTIELVLV